MRDAIELEWAGIAAVPIIHEAVRGSAQSMARLSGHPDYDFVVVDYPWIPTAMWSDSEIQNLAEAVAPTVIERLCGKTGADR
ncbi:MAG: hypothetical protein AB8G23_08215 [Myxococcota bacterium]